MSAPPLPEVFGNYALGDFVEAVPPADISWFPQTAGWTWLAALLLAYLLRRGWRSLVHWYRNRYRREAIALLQQLDNSANGDAWLTELNKLLKLAALAAFPRERVARLSGEEWVRFLNSRCTPAPFSAEQGKLLSIGTYNRTKLTEMSRQQLLAASLNWLRNHRAAQHD
ncbi:MAG: DUF4381 domain-containing protein [Halioglobus sp.]